MTRHPTWCNGRCTVERRQSHERPEHRSQAVAVELGPMRALAWIAQEPDGVAELRLSIGWPEARVGATAALPLPAAGEAVEALSKLLAEAGNG